MIDLFTWLFFISCIIFALIVWTKIGLFHNIKYLFKKRKYLK